MEGLQELIAACSACPGQTLRAAIEADEEHWFTGSPAPSDEGTIALAQTPSLIFRTEDVRAVHKHGGRYFVGVAGDANLMISHRRTIKAKAAACACHGKSSAGQGENGRSTLQRAIGDRIDPDADVNFIEDWGCWWRFNCYTVNLPLLGPVRVCIPTGYYCS